MENRQEGVVHGKECIWGSNRASGPAISIVISPFPIVNGGMRQLLGAAMGNKGTPPVYGYKPRDSAMKPCLRWTTWPRDVRGWRHSAYCVRRRGNAETYPLGVSFRSGGLGRVKSTLAAHSSVDGGGCSLVFIHAPVAGKGDWGRFPHDMLGPLAEYEPETHGRYCTRSTDGSSRSTKPAAAVR
ncbi:hypothetical protein Salat_2671000 [Sesamum alatum]|uniref:Uncharacterized protein n=1 Tax=Sesamum alatum TaxID=300844 RepID=A0AAE1XQF7_9LAMI|nr:hypothetical protein Salat_2671000 [Sesamum alatum]